MKMHVTIVRRYDFEAAHFLPHVPDGHKCKTMHGHSYVVEVHVTGDVQTDGPEAGMVVDFGVLDDIARRLLPALTGADLYVSEKLFASAPAGARLLPLPMGPMLADAFTAYDCHVFIISVGAVVRMIAPYSCFVVRISSSGRTRSERMTAFSPAVAFGTKTRSRPRAPTKAASAARASSMRLTSVCSQNHGPSRRAMKSVGSRSSSCCQRWYSSKTAFGHAP